MAVNANPIIRISASGIENSQGNVTGNIGNSNQSYMYLRKDGLKVSIGTPAIGFNCPSNN